MQVENIHDNWGSIVRFENPLDFFNNDKTFWTKFLYDRKMVVFKTMSFSKEDYCNFTECFGKPWDHPQYRDSLEACEVVSTKTGNKIISPFSNKIIARITNAEMPWHSDIPNHATKPFPHRALWITSNPNGQNSGHTTWMNLELAIDLLTDEQKTLLDKIIVMQQSWHRPGTGFQEFPILKQHPVTGNFSLRLNYYNRNKITDAWIHGVKIDGAIQSDCSLIGNWIRYLEQFPQLLYTHVWDLYDIAIYDNWSLIHKRSPLQFDNGNERHFYRVNIDHEIL